MAEKQRVNVQIVTAIIGVVGVIGAALIANPKAVRELFSGSTSADSAKHPIRHDPPPHVPNSATTTSGTTTLRAITFNLPEDGTPNKNGYIGDFCCTGTTVAVVTTEGKPVGYLYAFSWTGHALSAGGKTLVPSVEVLLSGSTNLRDPSATRDTGSVLFHATDAPGTTHTANLGMLRYDVTLTSATPQALNGSYMDLASVHVTIKATIR